MRWLDNANATSGNLFYPYDFYYEQIRMANTIILNAPALAVPQASKDKVMGEAYAFRAFSYYMLVQIYANRYVAGGNNAQLGVPLRTSLDFEAIPRSSVEEVYTLINTDLALA